MAVKRSINGKTIIVESTPKKTKQGLGKNTKYAATSRNVAKKKYRGQGKK
jgi:predicted GTPase